MADSHDPIDRLRGFGDGPVPVLAAAEAVRSRGDQRRRNGRTIVGVLGAAVVLAGGAAFGLGGSSNPDSLAPDPGFASSSPSSSSSPSCPPGSTESTAPDGTTTLTTCYSASYTPQAVPPEALLTAAEAARIAGGTWTQGDDQEHNFPLQLICGDDRGGVSGLHRSVTGPGTQSLLAQVVRYPAGTGDVVARVVADVARCPSRAEDAAPPATAEVSNELVRTDEDSAVVLQTSRECDPACRESTRLVVVVQVGDLVGYLGLRADEQGRTTAWAAAVRDRLAGCAQGTCPGAGSGTSLRATDALTATGIGPVLVGMPLDEVEAAAGQPFTTFEDQLGNGCGYVSPRSTSPAIALRVDDGKVSTVEVSEGGTTRTAAGIGLGDTLAAVRAAYGERIRSEQNPYTFTEVLVVPEPDGVHGYLFDSDGSEVVALRAGRLDALRSFEGCA